MFPVQKRKFEHYHRIQHIQINLSTNVIFWFFGQNFPKKGVSSPKHDKRTAPSTTAYLISLGTKFHFKQTILIVLEKFFSN